MKFIKIDYIIPLSVLYKRYYIRGFFGFLFIEIIPYLLCAFFSKISLSSGLFAIITLYSFYEIGYLWNDKISIKKELRPKIRTEFKIYNLCIFIFLRLFISGFLVYFSAKYSNSNIIFSYALAITILIIFYLHNSIEKVRWRLLTFVLLNFLKVLFILKLMNSDINLMIGFLPFLFIKTINYMRVKELADITATQESSLYLPIFLSGLFLLPFFSFSASVICATFLIIYNRIILFNFFFKNNKNIF